MTTLTTTYAPNSSYTRIEVFDTTVEDMQDAFTAKPLKIKNDGKEFDVPCEKKVGVFTIGKDRDELAKFLVGAFPDKSTMVYLYDHFTAAATCSTVITAFIQRCEEVLGAEAEITFICFTRSHQIKAAVFDFMSTDKKAPLHAVLAVIKPVTVEDYNAKVGQAEAEIVTPVVDATDDFIKALDRFYLIQEDRLRHKFSNPANHEAPMDKIYLDTWGADWSSFVVKISKNIKPGSTIDLGKTINHLKLNPVRHQAVVLEILNVIIENNETSPQTSLFKLLPGNIWFRTHQKVIHD